MRKAAKSLTSDLDITYNRIMNTINERREIQRESALDILAWISTATRPLHFRELQLAVSIEDGDTEVDEEGFLDAKTIVDLCGGLVTTEHETGIVRFVHYTVQEYLLPKTFISSRTHKIAKSCLMYLSFGIFSTRTNPWDWNKEGPTNPDFGWYAAANWGIHMRAINEPDDLLEKALDILQTPALLTELGKAMRWRSSHRGFTNFSYPLHIASFLGLVRLVRLLLDIDSININSVDQHKTPLSCAAEKGHEAVVKLLLDRKDINPEFRDSRGRTPLSVAANNGHEAVVQLLLDRGDVNPNLGDTYGETPLLLAASNGHEAVVRLLLGRKDINPDSKTDSSETPLFYAAHGGYEAIVKLLLDREDVNPDSKTRSGWTPLSYAVQAGHEAVVKLLLSREDVDPDSKTNSGRTPLSYAVGRGYEAIAKLISDRIDEKRSLTIDSSGSVGKEGHVDLGQ